MKKFSHSLLAFALFITVYSLFTTISTSESQNLSSQFQNDVYLPLIARPPGPCDVPTDIHLTIQSAVDDAGCLSINLTAVLYVENVTIGRDVTIQGQEPGNNTVNGNANGTVITVLGDADVTLVDMTIVNGLASQGGGIHNEATVRAINSAIRANVAEWPRGYGGYGGYGGGIYNSGTLILTGSTVSGNEAYQGAGIFNEGTANLINSIVDANSGYDSGGIHSEGETVQLTNSTISDNSAEECGGGIKNVYGLLVVNTSTIKNNWVVWCGGGIWNGDNAIITASTISGNVAEGDDGFGGYGGGIFNLSIMTVTNSTLSGNSANYGGGIKNRGSSGYGEILVANSTLSGNSANEGGGLHDYLGGSPLINTIIANSISGGDCNMPMVSQGYNIASDNTCDLDGPGDMNNTNPRLSPLQNNGGPTLTHALRSASPAIDEGTNASCPSTDQRGFPRPIDGDGDGTAVCDIGAVERQ